MTDGHTDRRTHGQTDTPTYIYPPLDKRYSPIISSICGPNKHEKKYRPIESYFINTELQKQERYNSKSYLIYNVIIDERTLVNDYNFIKGSSRVKIKIALKSRRLEIYIYSY